jgi:hypothetical protein
MIEKPLFSQPVIKKFMALRCIGNRTIVSLKVPFHKANERRRRLPASKNRSTVKARFRRPRIVVERPDYAGLAREVEAMSAQVIPCFQGEAREEVDLIFKEFQAILEAADLTARRVRGAELDAVEQCEYSARAAIPDLKHYEVDEVIIQRFEEIRSDLNAWAGELRARGHAPSGPASPPL